MKNLDQLIKDKYISVQKHPTEDLFIYNYTQKAQFERMWTEETLACRGLIMDGNRKVIARPFGKFFNLEEEENLPAEDFEVFEKLDGSLGILYFIGEKPFIATRGSFISEQAVKATAILHEKYGALHLNKDVTYLFEIIYPQNRIVVDYGKVEDIYLLAIIETKTGIEYAYDYLKHANFPIIKRYDGISDLSKIKELQEDNKEGFVIRFKSGKRLKIKFEEYVRLHRLVTGINARRIWDLLRNGQSMEELLDRVPDEFYIWVRATKAELEQKYSDIEEYAKKVVKKVSKLDNRREQAHIVLEGKFTSVVFNMLDKKDYSPAIWGYLKPRHEVPFKTTI